MNKNIKDKMTDSAPWRKELPRETKPFTNAERMQLGRCNEKIERILEDIESFRFRQSEQIGKILTHVLEKELYREEGFSFEDYCGFDLGMSAGRRSRSPQLLQNGATGSRRTESLSRQEKRRESPKNRKTSSKKGHSEAHTTQLILVGPGRTILPGPAGHSFHEND